MPNYYDLPPIGDCIERLVRSGWTMRKIRFEANSGRMVWRVGGHNGENEITSEGATPAEAWHRAVEAASACGMLKGWPRPPDGK
jgi:hypothetical protein